MPTSLFGRNGGKTYQQRANFIWHASYGTSYADMLQFAGKDLNRRLPMVRSDDTLNSLPSVTAHSWSTIPLVVLLYSRFLNSSPYNLRQISCNPDLTLHTMSSLCFLLLLYFSERGTFYNHLLFSVVKLKSSVVRTYDIRALVFRFL